MAALDQVTRPPSTGATGPPRVGPRGDGHPHRRFFIGPMPEKMLSISGAVGDAIRRADANENESLSRAMDNHAFHFFMLQGGKLESWNDDTRAHVRADLIRSWRENDWVRRFQRRSGAADRHPTRWSGCTFEIGNLLGVNILDKHPQAASDPSTVEASDHAANAAVASSSMAAGGTYVAAPANSCLPSPNRSLSPLSEGSGNDIHSSSLAPLLSPSATALSEPSEAGAAALQRPILKKDLLTRKGDSSGHGVQPTTVFDRGTARATSVQTPDAGSSTQVAAHENLVDGLPSGGSPAPPDDVLTRAGHETAECSAGAIDAQPRQPRDDEVILRGKYMPVRKPILY